MRFFKAIKEALATPDTSDADLYGYIAEEVASGVLREGLWAKALTEAEFDQQKAKVIYMKMAVSDLKIEIANARRAEALHAREVARIEADQARAYAEAQAAREAMLMEQAYDLYSNGNYDDATEGFTLLYERQKLYIAAAYLAYIYLNGLNSAGQNVTAGISFASVAEQSDDSGIRKFVGDAFRRVDEVRALSNYEFASKRGHSEARSQAKQLRAVLENEGKVPKRGLFDFF